MVARNSWSKVPLALGFAGYADGYEPLENPPMGCRHSADCPPKEVINYRKQVDPNTVLEQVEASDNGTTAEVRRSFTGCWAWDMPPKKAMESKDSVKSVGT
jgi:hypothetical protein